MLVTAALLMVVLSNAFGYSPLSPSPYNTYTLQAMAWREGRAYLEADVPHLELAIYQGRYFVSFPPVPSIPIFILTFMFGDQVPDNLLVALYMLLALFVLYNLFHRKGYSPAWAAFSSFLFAFASSMLPMALTGAVWYQAQMLAFLLTAAAMERMDADKPSLGLLLFALAVGCRPFNVLYGPVIIMLHLMKHKEQGKSLLNKQSIKTLLPGMLLGLLVAAIYAAYNLLRFDNPLEFGHNHLPEFSFQGGTQFSFDHLQKNINQFIFSWPYDSTTEGLALKKFGFSLFLANPVLLLMLIRSIVLAVKKKLTLRHGIILFFFFVHLLTLLLHRTFGGFQFGARYAVDLIPYAALFYAQEETEKPRWLELVVLTAGLVFTIYGSLQIHL